MSARITLFLMTQKGHAVLNALLGSHPALVAGVVASQDSNIRDDYYSAIKTLCRESGLDFHDRQEGHVIETEYAMAVSWRWLLQFPPPRLIVFHDSLLPKYRGFNPLVTALINGDEQIGVTALFGSEGYDTGDIIAQSAARISYPLKIQQAFDLISRNYAELAVGIASAIAAGRPLKGKKQDQAKVSYSLWRDEEDYRVDWSRSSVAIKRFIDAVGFPYKGASALVDGNLARILDAEVVDDVIIENRSPGKVIFVEDACPVVVCGQGLLKITALQDDQSGASLLPLPRFRMRFK